MIKKICGVLIVALVLLCSCSSENEDNSYIEKIGEDEKENEVQKDIELPTEIEEYMTPSFDVIGDDLDIVSCRERNLFDIEVSNKLIEYANKFFDDDPILAYELWHSAMTYLSDFSNILYAYPHYFDKDIIMRLDEFCDAFQESDSIYKIYTDTVSTGNLFREEEAKELSQKFATANKIVSDYILLYTDSLDNSILIDPAIGMTHKEVEASTWGKPQDINKTTYAWGTTEQWCYSGHRYIYFENGIVTAISE